MMNKWSIRIIIGVVILTLVGTGIVMFGPSSKKTDTAATTQAAQFQPLDTSSTKVVAEYSGGKITEGELNSYVNMFMFFQPELAAMVADKTKMQEFKQERLQDLAAKKYISSKVSSASDDVKKVDKTLSEIEKRKQQEKKTKDSFSKMVEGKGFTVDQLKQIILQGQKSERFYTSKLQGKTFDYVKVRHILVSTMGDPTGKDKKKRTEADAKKLATEVQQKLKNGGDFAKLAKQYSDDPGSKENGGIIEGSADQYVPEFANAAKTLPFGKISDLIKTSYGYHIIKVEDRKKQTADKAPEQVKQLKMQEIFQEVVVKDLKFKSLLPVIKPASK